MLSALLIAVLAGSPDAGVPGPEIRPAELCIPVRCYCAEKTEPKVCFCAQPDPKNGTVFVFSQKIAVVSADGGRAEFDP